MFIRIPAVGLMDFHPFSISSYPGAGNTFSVHIKSSVASDNGWTSRLMKFMKEHENKPEHYKNISVQIEGPFGELTLRKELSRYEHVVFIGGGIGITPLDSMYNQLVTDLLDNNIGHTVKTKKIDFIFTTRSRSLITEFCSRNTAWKYYAENREDTKMESVVSIEVTPAIGERRTSDNLMFANVMNLPLPPLADEEFSVQTSGVHSSPQPSREITKSMILGALDKEVGTGKPQNIVFCGSRESVTSSNETFAKDLPVDSLEITNSTHITRIKSDSLKRQYKETYPFINFKRPNIRGIIYKAASDTYSKDICVLTSGPKGMINECKRWAAEIGVDVHSEVFDW